MRFIRTLKPLAAATPTAPPSFSAHIAPLLEEQCARCHSQNRSLGGWDAFYYAAVMTTGDNGPVVVAGDTRGSLLGQKVRGTPLEGDIMPPRGLMAAAHIQLILDWIAGGAPNN